MPADGSQFLTRFIYSRTSRGDGSRQDHEQTVQYNDQIDRTERFVEGADKVVETTQENMVNPIRDTTKAVPRSIAVTVTLKFLNETVTC